MLVTIAAALCALSLAPSAMALTPPSSDPFYKVPSNVAKYKPGAIISSRPVPTTLAGGLAYKAAYQILYRTTDNSGQPDATVGTIIVPSGSNADPTKLVSYQLAEDSAYINCAPSYSIQNGASLDAAFLAGIELGLLNMALQNGWYVVTPDYEGPDSTFLANKGAGQRTLDGIRAALQSKSLTGVSPNAKYALWGYSGGSLASGFAAELAATYAPELKPVGVALGGTVPNIIDVLYTVNKGLFAGLIPSGIAGLSQAYPALATYINKTILPSKQQQFNQAKTQCLSADILTYAFQDVYTYTNNPNAFTNPLATSIVNANMQGKVGPKFPVYIYKGALDEISPINDTQILVNSYCAKGTSVDYVVYQFADHIGLLLSGASNAVTWLAARFAGVGQTGCSTSSM